MHATAFAQKLNETFSGNISIADAKQIINSYLELDGLSLAPFMEGDKASAADFRAMVNAQILGSAPIQEGFKEKLADIIDAYLLKEYNQSLDRFMDSTGSGSQAYQALAQQIKDEGTIVLGIPGSVEHTARKQKLAAQRMALGNKYKWSMYTCQSVHNRDEPQKQKHDGIINWVRVTLPENKAPLMHPQKNDIQTPIGWVRASDHLAFSNEELRSYVFNDHYPNGINEPGVRPQLPDFKRVDLVTPARYNGIRFAPLAIYIGYAEENSTTPVFYAMTGGNALGQSKILYVSTDVDQEILMECGYRPTPFADPENFYQFKTTFDGMDPVHVSINVYTEAELENGQPHHFNINLALEKVPVEDVASLDNFIPPASQLLAAFLRIVELLMRGVPQTQVSTAEMQLARLKQKRTKRASNGMKTPVLDRRIQQLEQKLESDPNYKLKRFFDDLHESEEIGPSHLQWLKNFIEKHGDLAEDAVDNVLAKVSPQQYKQEVHQTWLNLKTSEKSFNSIK